MKLIYCQRCHDVFNLTHEQWKMCSCGLCGGQYNKDLMTATIGGRFTKVLGLPNPFFNEFWSLLTDEAKEKIRKCHGYTGTDAWWGDYEGEQQLFHIEDPNGPRLKVRVQPQGGSFTSQNKVEIIDTRDYYIDNKKNHGFVIVPANPLPMRRVKLKDLTKKEKKKK